MADIDPHGRPIPVLLTILWASFVLMILSGIFYGLGLPEEWARGLFVATVIIWIVIGVALIIQGQMDVRTFARATASSLEGEGKSEKGTGGSDGGEG